MITVDPDSPIPVYEQLIAGILHEIDDGELKRGDRLPPVRRLAGDLGIAPGTVARTYQYLEERGVLSTHGRRGTYVSGGLGPKDVRAREAAEAYLQVMIEELGFSRREAIQHLTRAAEARS
ncbi:MAG: GntR family transcriptional regulator [Ancrocorticia sp.]